MSAPDEPLFDSPPGKMVSITIDGPCAVIGDIHGRSDLLARLLAKLPKDLPVLVAGDLCDRGPDTRGVLDLLISRGARGAIGNHEEWLLRWAQGGGFLSEARAMGATPTLTSYGVTSRDEAEVGAAWRAVPRAHVAFLESLGHVVDLKVGGAAFWIVHAGIGITTSLAAAGSLDRVVPYLLVNAPDVLLWGHTAPEATLPVDRPVVMGHLTRRSPKDFGHVLAIDTGCGVWPDGRLTAVLLPERRFVTVE